MGHLGDVSQPSYYSVDVYMDESLPHRADVIGLAFERFYSLNDSVVGSFPHLHCLGFQPALPNLCGGNGVSVLPYAHPQLFKVFKHLRY